VFGWRFRSTFDWLMFWMVCSYERWDDEDRMVDTTLCCSSVVCSYVLSAAKEWCPVLSWIICSGTWAWNISVVPVARRPWLTLFPSIPASWHVLQLCRWGTLSNRNTWQPWHCCIVPDLCSLWTCEFKVPCRLLEFGVFLVKEVYALGVVCSHGLK